MVRLTRLQNDDGLAAVQRYLALVREAGPTPMFRSLSRQGTLDRPEGPGAGRSTVRFDVTPEPPAEEPTRHLEGLREWIDGYRSIPVEPTRRGR